MKTDFFKATKKAMNAYAQTLKPSPARAQCLRIANYDYDTNIAEKLESDHRSADGALRAAQLMIDAKCAREEKNVKPHLFGIITFLDGSKLE